MRIIDLLNKIAKGEEVPKKIKLDEEIYEFNKWGNDYKLIGEEYSHWLFNDYCFGSNGNRLNNEIEIIEEVEDKEYEYIEELKIECMENQPSSKYIVNEYGTKCFLTKHSKIIADKVNEVIRNQKKILERLDK